MKLGVTIGLAALALGGLAAQPASAQDSFTCNMNAEDAANGLRRAVAASPKSATAELAQLDQMVETCPTDRGVIAYASESWLRHAYAGIPDEDAFSAVSHVWDMLYQADAIARDPEAGGPSRDYGKIFYELRKPAAQGLIKFHDVRGLKHPLFESDEPFDRCLVWSGNLGQTLLYDFDDTWQGRGTVLMLRRLARACPTDKQNQAYPWWLKAASGVAGHTEDAAFALELLEEARLDGKAYLNGKDAAYQWTSEDQAKLESQYEMFRLAGMTEADLIPVAALFTPEHLGTEEAARSIGWRLDQAWGALDTSADGAAASDENLARMKAYTLALTPMYHAAKAAGPEARKFLFEIAEAHAAGQKWRRAETQGIPGPKDYMYIWVDPDYAPGGSDN